MAKVLVTGGAGFIGSHVVDRLLKEGKEVIVVDNFNEYYSPQRKRENIAHHANNPNFTLAEGDVENFSFIARLFDKYKIQQVIHLAARAGVRPSIENPFIYNSTNLNGTLNVLELSRRQQVKSFVFASSSSVYGMTTKIPFVETDNVNQPVSPYAATKRAGELLCFTYSHLHNLNLSCLRFFTVYGPRGRPDMAPYRFTDKIYRGQPITVFGDGRTARDYTYIYDIVDGIMVALDRSYKYEIFNLGNNQMIPLKQFIHITEGIIGKSAIIQYEPPIAGDVERTCADISKAQRLLRYMPRTSVREGMQEFFEWYKEHEI